MCLLGYFRARIFICAIFYALSISIFRWTSWPWSFIWEEYIGKRGDTVLPIHQKLSEYPVVSLAMFAIRYHRNTEVFLCEHLCLLSCYHISLMQVQMDAETVTTTLRDGLSFDFSWSQFSGKPYNACMGNCQLPYRKNGEKGVKLWFLDKNIVCCSYCGKLVLHVFDCQIDLRWALHMTTTIPSLKSFSWKTMCGASLMTAISYNYRLSRFQCYSDSD